MSEIQQINNKSTQTSEKKPEKKYNPVSYNQPLFKFNNKPHVLVIDDIDYTGIDTNGKEIDIDGDGKPDKSHGEIVDIAIKDFCPDAEISHLSYVDIIYWNKISERLDKGEKIDAINMSFGQDMSYKMLSDITGISGLNSKNILKNRDKVVAELRKIAKNPKIAEDRIFKSTGKRDKTTTELFNKIIKETKHAVYMINNIEKISSRVPVYICAGNVKDSIDSLSLYSLAKGARVIGGYGSYSYKNSLVKRQEGGTMQVNYTINDDKLGYDLTNDGIPDVLFSETSGKGMFDYKKYIQGTSFSTPRALGYDLRMKRYEILKSKIKINKITGEASISDSDLKFLGITRDEAFMLFSKMQELENKRNVYKAIDF